MIAEAPTGSKSSVGMEEFEKERKFESTCVLAL